MQKILIFVQYAEVLLNQIMYAETAVSSKILQPKHLVKIIQHFPTELPCSSTSTCSSKSTCSSRNEKNYKMTRKNLNMQENTLRKREVNIFK